MFNKVLCWLALIGLLTAFPIILILALISGYILAEDDPYSDGIEAIVKSNRIIPRIVKNWLETYFHVVRTLTNGTYKSDYDKFF